MAYYFKSPASKVLPAIVFSVILQMIFIAFSALVFERGKDFYLTLFGPGFLYLTIFCMAGYWAGSTVFLIRRRREPEELDLFFYRYGFICIFVISYILSVSILSL